MASFPFFRRSFALVPALRQGTKTRDLLAGTPLVLIYAFNANNKVRALIEANWLIRQGHNLKITGEYYDPNRNVSNDQRTRWSLVYEYTPIQFLQLRGGVRYSDGIPQLESEHTRVYFIQLHGYF